MKKQFLLLVAILSSLMASAYDAEIDGIYYNLIKTKMAEVTSGDTKYTGSVNIPSSITYEGVTYSVTAIRSYAFYGCSSLTSITIPNNVTSIGESAFSGCSGLTSIEIPNNVTSIEFQAFRGCSSLTSIDIPNSVTSIGKYAFADCSGLISVTIPNSVTSIGQYAFTGCWSLKSVNITDIAAWCKISFSDYDANPLFNVHHLFMNGNEIKDLVIPNSITSIGSYAFMGCSSLTSITIPNSVTSIGKRAFELCSGLTSIEIPNSVTSIGSRAFWGCSSLKSVTIPNSVTSIGERVFSSCSSLTSIEIPNSVTSIGSYAFSYCSGLTSLTIPNSVKSIGYQAFQNCSGLTSVTIGSGVTLIDSYAFQSCSNLTDVYCYAENVPRTYSDDVFKDSYIDYATLHVPEASINAYKTTAPWSGFGTIKTLSGDIPVTEKCATPTISFVDGKVQFECETVSVEYVYNITPPSAKSGSGTNISMPTTYKVTVYATKAGYENSDVATKEIDLGTSCIRGDLNGDGIVNMPDAMFIVNKMLKGKFPDE